MTRIVTGRCLCEQVRYEIRGEFGTAYNCHCSKCRRWHGAAFRSRASIRRDQFRWLTGEDRLSVYKSSATTTKYFCSTCGSNLISTYDDRPEVLGIALGPLEQNPGVMPAAHIFVGSKAPWYPITDDLPQYENWPGSEAEVRKTR